MAGPVPIGRRSIGLLGLLLLPGPAEASHPARELWLWAWERPEDLRFLPDDVGVAYLAETVVLGPEPMTLPRRQPLRVHEQQRLMAVVRVEADASASLDASTRSLVVDRVVEAASACGVTAVQIDFDARASQRDEYRMVLASVRERLAPDVELTITALGSWCVGDRWIEGEPLPVDDVVPMLFDMGRDSDEVTAEVDRLGQLPSPRCRRSVGVRLGQPLLVPSAARRVFVFNADPWTADAYSHAREGVG